MIRNTAVSLLFCTASIMSTAANADDANSDFHERFVKYVEASMKPIDCEDTFLRLKDKDGVKPIGKCHTFETKPFTNETGQTNYTYHTRAVTDQDGNIITMYALRLNSGGRTYLNEFPASEMLGYTNPGEARMLKSWGPDKRLKVGMLKTARAQRGQRHDDNECLAAVTRKSQVTRILLITCNTPSEISEEALSQVVRAIK